MAVQTSPLGFNKVKFVTELFVRDRWSVMNSIAVRSLLSSSKLTFSLDFPCLRAGVAPVEGADQKETE